MRNFVIDEQTLMAVVGYLSKEPFKKVAQIIQKLTALQEVKIEQKDEK
jgi:hypothetical protein